MEQKSQVVDLKTKKNQSGLERIQGGSSPDDRGIRLNLPEMEVDRTKSIDAATEYLFGKKCHTLAKPSTMPTAFITFLLGVLSTSIVWHFFL